jgi:delta 1-pyrroline-5-carboxylate dehydrogenase
MGLTKRLRLVYKPLGVVGIIVPWNGPFVLAMNQAAQALMAAAREDDRPTIEESLRAIAVGVELGRGA